MQMWNKLVSWIKKVFTKKQELPDFDEWYEYNIDKYNVPKKYKYLYYFKNGMMQGIHEWLDEQSGIKAFPYFDDDLECEDLYLVVSLTAGERTYYSRLVKHCGGKLHYKTWRLNDE